MQNFRQAAFLAIGVLSHAGPVNLAAALRHHSRDPYRPLAALLHLAITAVAVLHQSP
jgi:hypothetical protein